MLTGICGSGLYLAFGMSSPIRRAYELNSWSPVSNALRQPVRLRFEPFNPKQEVGPRNSTVNFDLSNRVLSDHGSR